LKITYLINFICIIFLSKNIFAQTIAVVNIQSLIDNNIYYIEIMKDMEINQDKNIEKFAIKEKELSDKLKDLEQSKLILNEIEINAQINNYNEELTAFTITVQEFNLHYQNQITNIREIILKEIFILLEKYAIENQVDLILDTANYLIASNSIDVTDSINEKLKNINLKLEYTKFEKN
tara:strand:- start:892 stop:1425 length:534 start_codon:yes stop_codon:yes gene_type:complete